MDDILCSISQVHLFLILLCGLVLQTVGFEIGSVNDVLASVIMFVVLFGLITLLIINTVIFVRSLFASFLLCGVTESDLGCDFVVFQVRKFVREQQRAHRIRNKVIMHTNDLATAGTGGDGSKLSRTPPTDSDPFDEELGGTSGGSNLGGSSGSGLGASSRGSARGNTTGGTSSRPERQQSNFDPPSRSGSRRSKMPSASGAGAEGAGVEMVEIDVSQGSSRTGEGRTKSPLHNRLASVQLIGQLDADVEMTMMPDAVRTDVTPLGSPGAYSAMPKSPSNNFEPAPVVGSPTAAVGIDIQELPPPPEPVVAEPILAAAELPPPPPAASTQAGRAPPPPPPKRAERAPPLPSVDFGAAPPPPPAKRAERAPPLPSVDFGAAPPPPPRSARAPPLPSVDFGPAPPPPAGDEGNQGADAGPAPPAQPESDEPPAPAPAPIDEDGEAPPAPAPAAEDDDDAPPPPSNGEL